MRIGVSRINNEYLSSDDGDLTFPFARFRRVPKEIPRNIQRSVRDRSEYYRKFKPGVGNRWNLAGCIINTRQRSGDTLLSIGRE